MRSGSVNGPCNRLDKDQRSTILSFRQINGLNYYLNIANPATDGPLLVFVNSLGCDMRIWDFVVARLTSRSAVLRYDKRGHGLSDLGQPPYSMEDHAADLAGLIEALGRRRAIIFGLSIGGMIAQSLYRSRPELIEALILCDTGARIGTPERYRERIEEVERTGLDAFAEMQVKRWFSARFREAHPEIVAGARVMLCRQSVAGYVGSCAALRDADYTDSVSKIRVPVLCLVGSEDISTPPAQMRALADQIDNARYVAIDGAGHLPCLEAPERVAAEIDLFLSELRISEKGAMSER